MAFLYKFDRNFCLQRLTALTATGHGGCQISRLVYGGDTEAGSGGDGLLWAQIQNNNKVKSSKIIKYFREIRIQDFLKIQKNTKN